MSLFTLLFSTNSEMSMASLLPPLIEDLKPHILVLSGEASRGFIAFGASTVVVNQVCICWLGLQARCAPSVLRLDWLLTHTALSAKHADAVQYVASVLSGVPRSTLVHLELARSVCNEPRS